MGPLKSGPGTTRGMEMYEPAPERHRSLSTVLALLVMGIIVAGLTGFGIGVGRLALARAHSSGQVSSVQTAPGGNLRLQPQTGATSISDPATVAARVTPAIVDINVTVSGGQASGTGMVLTSDGQILTNNHVVQGATSIAVNIAGQSRTYRATVLGVDTAADVALIKVQGVSGWPTVALADSSTARVGEEVVAIGNALGRNGAPTVTAGTITALDQSITAQTDLGSSEQLTGLLETSASISPGDSGGAIVNGSGQVVGMITAGSSGGRRRGSTIVGYAVPANAAAQVVDQVRAGRSGGTVVIGTPGYLGIQVRDTSSGALIVGTLSGSAAESAGIASGSVITAINGTQVANSQELGAAIHAFKPGQRITVAWIDPYGRPQQATVALQDGPPA